MPVSPEALVARGATEVEGAAAATAARASKVFLLWLPFGRPCFRDTEGAISCALTFSLLPSGTLSPLAAEPLRDDMTGWVRKGEARGKGRIGGNALSNERAQHLKRSDERDNPLTFR
jgi:hypothetical protein